MKKCKDCSENKHSLDFYKNKRKSDGLDLYCKKCSGVRKKISHQKHRDKNLRKMKEYREKNPTRFYEMHAVRSQRWLNVGDNAEKMKEYHKRYSDDNSDKKIKVSTEWYVNNPTRHSEILKKYRATHSEVVLARVAKRRAQKLNAIPSWFEKEQIDQLYMDRTRISEETGIIYHVDHIIPLNSSTVCGLHCFDNLQIITATENLRKTNSFAHNNKEKDHRYN